MSNLIYDKQQVIGSPSGRYLKQPSEVAPMDLHKRLEQHQGVWQQTPKR